MLSMFGMSKITVFLQQTSQLFFIFYLPIVHVKSGKRTRNDPVAENPSTNADVDCT